MPIRRHLLLLVFSLLVPAVIACGVAVAFTYSFERQRTEDNLLRTTQALAESLDRRFITILERLKALATSPALAERDFHRFWQQSRRAVPEAGLWVVVTDRDGRQVMNTLRPFGTALPSHDQLGDPISDLLRATLETGKPAVSDMFTGPVSGKPIITVSIPVADESGQMVYVLSMAMGIELLAADVAPPGLPKNWLAAVFDTKLALAARSRPIPNVIGRPAVPELAAAMRSAKAGITDAVSREGILTRVAFSRSPTFGWHFAIGVPTAELLASVYRTLMMFGAFALTLLASATLVALAIARRISRAIGMLAPAAADLRGGFSPVHRATGVAEVDEVSVALERTGRVLRDAENERRRAEESVVAAKERAEDVLSSIADGFYALDGEWRFTYMNARAEQILGKSAAEVMGVNFFETFPQVRNSPVHDTYRQVMVTRRPQRFDYVSPILKRWTSFSVYPAQDGGISVYFSDISERKATEEALIAAKDEAEHANKAKSQFLAAASHDLRQPVQSLFFFHEILAGKLRTHAAAPIVATMQSALDALKSLLDGLLDISRLHAGTVTVEKSAFPVALLLDRIDGECAARAEAQGVVLRVVRSTAWVRSDMAQLERILRNLVDNALKYTPRGGEVLVGCRRQGGMLNIQVVDTGPGIPPDKQETIFEEFIQLGNPERDRAKGLGLGLAIVRQLSRLLGHEISLRSRIGHGTMFAVAVPLARARRERAGPVVPLRPPHAGGLALVVDDEALILIGMRSMLEAWGWEVMAADCGQEAVRLVAGVSRPPDVIIADYRLRGDETGLKVIRDVHGVCGLSIPAVVLTGDTSPERIAECAGSGFRLLHKPVDAVALQHMLDRLRA